MTRKNSTLSGLALAVLCTLQACGGGGGGGGGGAPIFPGAATPPAATPPATPEPGPGPGPAPGPGPGSEPGVVTPPPPPAGPPAPVTPVEKFTYKLGTAKYDDPAAIIAELSLPANKGYRPSGAMMTDNFVMVPLYEAVSTIDAYSFALVADPDDATVIKRLGARGYARMPPGFSAIYAKPSASTTTLEYTNIEFDPLAATPSAQVVAKLNALGAQGYCERLMTSRLGEDLMRREVPFAGACEYEVQPMDVGFDKYYERLKSQGDKGWLPFLRGPLDNEGMKQIYVRNVTRNPAVSYYLLSGTFTGGAPTLTGQALESIAKANLEGAKGARFFASDNQGLEYRHVYSLLGKCLNFLCQPAAQ